jgi:hypothetical protein
MLGWYVVVFKTEATHLDHEKSTDDLRIASWSTGMKGRDWLNNLVKEKEITYLGGNGYPFRYSSQASKILPIITSRITSSDKPIISGDDCVLQSNELQSLKLDLLKISDCGPNEHLLIEVWDQS